MTIERASPLLAVAIALAITGGASACEWKKQVSASASPPTDAATIAQATPVLPLTLAADQAPASEPPAVAKN